MACIETWDPNLGIGIDTGAEIETALCILESAPYLLPTLVRPLEGLSRAIPRTTRSGIFGTI